MIDNNKPLLLIFVSYHTPISEVKTLKACLKSLDLSIEYAVAVNDYQVNEPIDALCITASYCIKNRDNLGYGAAINRIVNDLDYLPRYIGVLNTDLAWGEGTFESILTWLNANEDVSLVVPMIKDQNGKPQALCKQNPTVLGLISRRFIPYPLKPKWLRDYDRWFTMSYADYSSPIIAQYLSGCCMIIKSESFLEVGGFDENFFLYLEDADITRKLSYAGKCVYLPYTNVIHGWGRGNYRSLRLMIVNIKSALYYFRKWGWAFF